MTVGDGMNERMRPHLGSRVSCCPCSMLREDEASNSMGGQGRAGGTALAPAAPGEERLPPETW